MNGITKFFSQPLYIRILAAALLGTLLGIVFGNEPILWGFKTENLSIFGSLIIRVIKSFASPLIFFAVVETFVHTQVRLKEALHLFIGCSINVVVAMGIGLFVLDVFHPGNLWEGKISYFSQSVGDETKGISGLLEKSHAAKGALNPIQALIDQFPESFAKPFIDNQILSIVILAIIIGFALRTLKSKGESDSNMALVAKRCDDFFGAALQLFMAALHIIVEFMPIAVFCVMASIVGKSGIHVFQTLWVFLATLLVGLCTHALVFYPLAAWGIGGVKPITYLKGVREPAITALSCNSSLATVPVTLESLKKMGVSEKSSRLSACVATNFNNDGITLYEAMAALFIAQAVGFNWTLPQQLTVIFTALLASLGSAGLPEAGLVLLPLVLAQSGLPDTLVATVIPLILPVDWIIARVRSAVNTMNDMLIAIYLDRWSKH